MYINVYIYDGNFNNQQMLLKLYMDIQWCLFDCTKMETETK